MWPAFDYGPQVRARRPCASRGQPRSCDCCRERNIHYFRGTCCTSDANVSTKYRIAAVREPRMKHGLHTDGRIFNCSDRCSIRVPSVASSPPLLRVLGGFVVNSFSSSVAPAAKRRFRVHSRSDAVLSPLGCCSTFSEPRGGNRAIDAMPDTRPRERAISTLSSGVRHA
jgi:hypothetical protein